LHEIEVSLQVKIAIPQDKKVTVGNIATAVRELGIESKIAENIIQTIDENEVRNYCGEEYRRGNGQQRYQRAGTSNREFGTSAGTLETKLHKIKDTETNETFKPIKRVIDFDGQRLYQEDISMIAVELATKMTYRDSVKEGKILTKSFPSACTVNQRVIEYGEKFIEFSTERTENASMRTVFADGTKTHSQEDGKDKNEINVVLGVENNEKTILGARVNDSWKNMSRELDNVNAIGDDAIVIGDGEKEMRYSLTNGGRSYQMDLIHASRITSFKLWEDKMMSLEDRKTIISRLEGVLYTLKNSVDKHFEDKNTEALKIRINNTVDELKKMAKELWKLGCHKASKFIKDYSNTIVTFAKLAVSGRKVPWNSNIIERLMGEIAKRAKHKWMRWTTRGLETIINIILVRYCSEKTYETFKSKIIKSENLTFIKGEVMIISVRGEF
jgi:transposase-like protein